jgi:hypothetical protein
MVISMFDSYFWKGGTTEQNDYYKGYEEHTKGYQEHMSLYSRFVILD